MDFSTGLTHWMSVSLSDIFFWLSGWSARQYVASSTCPLPPLALSHCPGHPRTHLPTRLVQVDGVGEVALAEDPVRHHGALALQCQSGNAMGGSVEADGP